MKLNINLTLDPVFETLGLLYTSCHMDKNKDAAISKLDKFGVDGEAFYNKHLRIYDKYIRAFVKKMLPDARTDFFFGDDSIQFFSVMAALLSNNSGWLVSLEEVPEQQIRAELLTILSTEEGWPGNFKHKLPIEEIQSLDELIAFLEQSPFVEGVKWKLLSMLQHPREHIQSLVDIINRNIPAFEKSLLEVAKPLDKLILKFNQSLLELEDEQFFKRLEMFAQDPIVRPSLIMPLAQIMFEKVCYYGLHVGSLPIIRKKHTDSKDLLLIRLKALGDNSKLQILGSLKVSPKYNLEIAEQLGLTAATMSHHMNVLMACGLVGIDKKNGRVYYHLDREHIGQFLNQLEHFLL